MFQEFYINAESHIATHINALSTRQSRVAAAYPSMSSKASSIVRDGNKLRPSSSREKLGSLGGKEQQMLTPKEVSDRRKARRLLDRKGIVLEEAVERRVCERVYNRIWRHRTTLDEVRDEKLRSRTAALALVGIGLQDLGIKFDSRSSEADISEVEQWISKARGGLLKMNDAKYPLGKLQQLAAAHKIIVDLLTELHQSSSSADEILPTLIYTLITSPPEGINVISNLHFIQRFRATSKVDGEAAYCLTNLEAAITFLETVDLATLRSDEPLEGPPKSTSWPATPRTEYYSESVLTTPTTDSVSIPINTAPFVDPPQATTDHPLISPDLVKPSSPMSPAHQRRLSHLFQPPASAFGAAGDAVRITADHGLKTIGNTLDNSFKLLFGRLQEHNVAAEGADADGVVVVPKTLADARKLMGPKSAEDEEPDVSPAILLAGQAGERVASNHKSDISLLGAFAGRRQSRDRSVDSTQSSSSGKKVATSRDYNGKADSSVPSPISQSETSQAGNAAVESIRNLGSTFNPLKGLGGMFGRNSLAGTPTQNPGAITPVGRPDQDSQRVDVTDKDSIEVRGPGIKILPPVQRFMVVSSAEELKIGEISDLLKDYRRLVDALKDRRAF